MASKIDIQIIPLGGLGQIGSNITWLKTENDSVLIDSGILFPSEDWFNINYLIPDIKNISPAPEHLIITHGHEDHIGAISHIINFFPNISIYAGGFTRALILKKLAAQKITHAINPFQHHTDIQLNDLFIDPIHVNHSIPQTTGLLIRHQRNSWGAFFASDFKINNQDSFERTFDFSKLIRLSKPLQKKILLADSTNIVSSNHETPSEDSLIPTFEKLISEAKGRIFITSFASNIERLANFFSLAKKFNRQVVPHGRSMLNYLSTAHDFQMIPHYDLIRTPEQVANSTNFIALLSGCQGDQMGTFRRFCVSEDSHFKPNPTDLVIISSKPIPGNEKKINALVNKLAELNIKVAMAPEYHIHVSGHPGKKDLQFLYEKFCPDEIIPIHGETHFLREHIRHIEEVYPKATGHFLTNFDELHLHSDLTLKIVPGTFREPLLIHGKQEIIERNKVAERRKISQNGAIFISLYKNPSTQKVHDFNYTFVGLPEQMDGSERKQHFDYFLVETLNSLTFKEKEKSLEELRISVRRYLLNILGYKPQTYIHL